MKVRWIASTMFSILMGLSLSSCNQVQSLARRQAAQSNSAQSLTDGGSSNVIQDQLGEMQITLPDGWNQDTRLHSGAGLQASNEEEDLYVIVLAEDKETLSQYSLEDNSGFYRRLLIEGLSNLEDQSPTETTSINGNSAAQYEISGEIEDARVTYLHTTVVTDDRYYQVVAWTNTDQYANRKPELREVVMSFREM